MKMTTWGTLATAGLCAWLGAGCCPELREFAQKGIVEITDEADRTFSFEAPDCFDTGKQVLFALLWRADKWGATIKLEGMEVAKLPPRTCDLVEQAVEALGGAIGGAIDDVIGDLGCAFHLFQGPDFERDDVVAIQDLKADDELEWQVFKLASQAVQPGKNEIVFEIYSESCTGEDNREASKMAYLLISDVDDPCDDKFRD